MGVPYLLSYLRKTYRSVFDKKHTPHLEHIYLDANAMLYQIATVTKDPVDIAHQLVDVAISYANVYKGIAHIYIDGVAHMAKLREQRMRRFTYDPISVPTISDIPPGSRSIEYEARVGLPWTSAMFSPGTEMMHLIHEEILTLVRDTDKIGTYSSYLDPSEGEHKIVDAIKLLPEESRIGIVGKDADLLLMGMILAEKGYEAYIIRHNDTSSGDRDGYRPEDPIWNIRCRLLREEILTSIAKTTIWDFIIATFIVGNDFLPPVPEMSSLWDVMPKIIRALAKLPSSLSLDDGVNWPMFRRYVSILLNTVPPNMEWLGIKGKISMEAFSESYYMVVSPFNVDTEKLVSAYIRTIDWVYLYYEHGPSVASISWQYPCHYAPTLTSLNRHLRDDIHIEWPDNRDEPLKPIQALACIIPPWLRSLLPEDIEFPEIYYPYAFDLMPVTNSPVIPIIPYEVASSI